MVSFKTLGKIVINKVFGPGDVKRVRCPKCGMLIKETSLYKGACPLCWAPDGQSSDFEDSSNGRRVTCKSCGASKHPDGIKGGICVDCLFADWKVGSKSNTQPMTLKKAYSVLECHETCSDDHLRMQYRRMAKLFHPDIVESKGLHGEFSRFAKEKFQEIGTAYDLIMESRTKTKI